MKKYLGFLTRPGEWKLFQFITVSIRNKLLTAFLALALIPLIIAGIIAFNTASTALNEEAFNELEAVRTIKTDEIVNYIEDRQDDMGSIAQTVNTLQQEALNELEVINQLKVRQLRELVDSWTEDVLDTAADPFIADGMTDIAAGFDDLGSRRAQALYQGKPQIGNAQDDSDYSEAHQDLHRFFGNLLEIHEFEQFILIDLEGNVVYTTGKGESFGTNLTSGPFQDSNLAQLYRLLQNGSVGQTEIVDAAPFEGKFSMFVGGAIFDGSRQVGILAHQVSFDQINAIVHERAGQGVSGETYFTTRFGDDDRIFFRSEMLTLGDGAYVPSFDVTDIAPEYLLRVTNGESGRGTFIDSAQNPVLAAYEPVDIGNLRWAAVSKIDAEETLALSLEGRETDIFADFINLHEFDDFYLFNADGYAFYSVSQLADYRTNLLTGPYQDTNLGGLVAEVLETQGLVVSDFARYEPAGNEPEAFVGQPILDSQGELVYIAALALNLNEISSVMQENTGLGESGETYLVGQDSLWRSDSRFLDQLGTDSTVLNEEFRVETVAARSALNGESGTQIIDDYRGVPVLSSWAPIVIEEPSAVDPDGVVWAMMAEIDRTEIQAPVINMAWIIGGLIVVATGLVVGGAFLLSGTLVRQINHITDLFGEIGIGNFGARTPVTTQDELGEMAASLNTMLDTVLALVQTQDERDKIQEAIMKLLTDISGVADGDLTAEAEVTEDMTGAIADSFNFMIGQLREVIRNVQEATVQVSFSANEIQATAQHLSQGSESQASQIVDTSAAVDEMSVSIQQVSDNAVRSAEVAQWALNNAQQGAQVVQETVHSMTRIRDQVEETSKRIARLGESSKEIGDIVQLIGDIADRTSILALNASIQAAMAGEAGQGFAVVAEEVESLAERATEATRQIAGIVKTIQSETNETVAAMEDSQREVVEGSHLADQAGQTLSEIQNVSKELAELIQSISMASKQQARGSEAVARSMNDIAEVTQQTAAGTRQAAVSISNLATLADGLRGSVSTFKLPDGSDNGNGQLN